MESISNYQATESVAVSATSANRAQSSSSTHSQIRPRLERGPRIHNLHSVIGTALFALNWYCIHVAPRQENKVALLLRRDLEIEVFAPRIRFRRMRAGRPIWTTEALFPGYLFARFEYFARRRQINALAGVTSVVHFGGDAAPVGERIMAELRALVRDHETVEVEAQPQPGSEVVITSGPMSGLRVLVTRVIPARGRIAILIELLGSEREIEIERGRVLPADPRSTGFVA